MKKSKLKAQAKSAKKGVQATLKSSLIAELQLITAALGDGSKKLEKEIKKGSAKLAKRLTGEIKIRKVQEPVTNEVAEAAAGPKIVKGA